VNLLISGASGLIGSDLVPLLQGDGHQVLRVTRSPRIATDVAWNLDSGVLHSDFLKGMDAVIHLAGESIASGRWKLARKGRISVSLAHAPKERN
jgi:NAD dependent epimerase/dehydratase family enzyme